MRKLSLFLLVAVSLGACKKDSDSAAPTPSRTDLLTAKNWRLTTATISVSGFPLPGAIAACSLDDFLKFGTDKVLTHDEGATKCDPTDPQTDKGTWDMPSEAKLTLALPNSDLPGGTFDIKELTATTMHLTLTDTSGGIPATVDITLTAF
ncbi:hypothetical protein GO988_07420 [Hymenobacter sp. HMF4947]|uniref:Lipocalin-like domain-containing protein n=1 Tax=Hymenobacter ginkgonis TaxID=2682976 RepID=A0A7K1TCM9_9BACT|nr:hypothetical protein [Hymenobacter ginkgonis]MVN76150.1 hypothetical protein [Hymenobacter ginkgonis]